MCPPQFILASASPRRRELLGALEIPFSVVPSHADETLPEGLTPAAAIEAVARLKADEVAARMPPGCWVLAADTAVVLGDRILGKPADRADAESMLGALAGCSHQVTTAGVSVCIGGWTSFAACSRICGSSAGARNTVR